MNNIPYKSIVGGLNITHDIYNSYSSNTDYFTESIIFGVKAKDNKTVIEADALSGVVNIPKLQYYVNAYTLTYGTHPTNEDTSLGFINAYSTYIFPVINESYAYTSYHVAIMAYTLPTKHYVDRLLELKDALIYRGTLTPNEVEGVDFPGIFQATTSLPDTESGAMSYSYTTAGSVYKVSTTGYFGNIHVHAGDMIISYSDSATIDSIEGWNVIEMHITHENESKKQLNKQTNAENRVLSNIKILHDGKLTYTYTHILENQIEHNSYVTDTSRQYVEYVDVEHNESTNDIYITYHTKILKFDNIPHKPDNIDLFGDNTYQFIINIHQDVDGHLSYEYTYVKTYSHHNTYCYNEVITTTDNPRYIINSIYLDDVGGLSYTYRNATIADNERIYNTSGNKNIFNTENADAGIKVITGINMTSDGQLSYCYSYVYDSHDSGSTGTEDTHQINNAETKQFLINTYVNSEGHLAYTYMNIWGHL